MVVLGKNNDIVSLVTYIDSQTMKKYSDGHEIFGTSTTLYKHKSHKVRKKSVQGNVEN